MITVSFVVIFNLIFPLQNVRSNYQPVVKSLSDEQDNKTNS